MTDTRHPRPNTVPWAISKLEFIGARAWLNNEAGIGFDNWDLEHEWNRFVAQGRVNLSAEMLGLWQEFGKDE